MIRVLLVTPWNQPCGIAEHSWYLKQAVEAADHDIEISIGDIDPFEPDQHWGMTQAGAPWFDLIWLNYQASLHSRWTLEVIERWRQRGVPIGCTFHDTGVPNSDLCKAVCSAADAFVIHEPADDLPLEKGHYWRMGVPDWSQALIYDQRPGSWCRRRPVLGSIGFAFPWKHYEQLAMITARAGWALLLIAPNATADQVREWTALNPHSCILGNFTPRAEALSLLAGCDATAFGYVCCNTGQSGAILQGIAARKPVLALSTCRQFRALYDDPLGNQLILWCETFEELERRLHWVPVGLRCDPGIVALAEQDSWQKLGQKYAALYRSLLA